MSTPSDHIAPFSFLTAGQIRFGRGTAKQSIPDIVRLGLSVLLVRGRAAPWADELASRLTDAGCSVIQVYGRGEPTVEDVEVATTTGRRASVDVVVAVGGGAVIDLGKAVAAMIPARTGLMDHLEGVGGGQPLGADPVPFIAIPTTAGTGAEVTKNAVIGVPEAGRKVSLRDQRMLPCIAIIDPGLTDCTPGSVTFSSGFDAVTQVIEPYVSHRANPLTDALCRAAIPMGLHALARLAKGEDRAARDDMAYVSLAGGLALANAGLGAVHGLAGVIGGRHAAPHGVICARLLGPILQRNQEAARASGAGSDRFTEIGIWMGEAFGLAPACAFGALGTRIDAFGVAQLGDWIGPDDDLDTIAAEAANASSMKANPFVLDADDLVRAVKEAL